MVNGNPHNSTIVIVTTASWIHVSDDCFLFYAENWSTFIFHRGKKNDRSSDSFSRKSRFTSVGPAVKKKKHLLMRTRWSRVKLCAVETILGNDLKLEFAKRCIFRWLLGNKICRWIFLKLSCECFLPSTLSKNKIQWKRYVIVLSK